MRKAKILATLGPASSSKATIGRLIASGANAFRFNFSHGTHEEHRMLFNTAKAAALEAGMHIPFIQDLQGPKIRVDLDGKTSVVLDDGAGVYLSADPALAGDDTVHIAYPPLCDDVKVGEPILIDDGKLRLVVTDIGRHRIRCRVEEGGILGNRKGVNLPGTRTSLSPITEKDKADLAVGLELGFDYVALSFVQEKTDLQLLKSEMDRHGKRVPIIAKLERPRAIDNIEEIADEADAIMVARGDLGIEIKVQRVPVIQKQIIALANRKGIPVITATQMLESMLTSTTPTRAETTDIANAVYDGTDVVMLSAETSAGRYPVEAVRMMRRIIREAEAFPDGYTRFSASFTDIVGDDEITTAHLAARAVENMDLKAILVYTQSGRTATLVSKFRPQADIFAFCPHDTVVDRMGILWGVTPVRSPLFEYTEGLIEALNNEMIRRGFGEAGDLVAITYGSPIPAKNPSNMLKLHRLAPDR